MRTLHFYIFLNLSIVLITSKKCPLPESINHGNFTVLNNLNHLDDFSIIQVTCQEDFTLKGCPFLICLNGKWTPTIGHCLKTCKPLTVKPQMTIKCQSDRCQITCQKYYEDTRIERRDLECVDGKWREEVECQPICGNVLNVNNETIYPWQAGLYETKTRKFLCGATLINENVILTAAHCTGFKYTGEYWKSGELLIAVGKRYPELGNKNDEKNEQERKVIDILLPDNYRGSLNDQRGDLAILTLDRKIIFNDFIQPICLDWLGKIQENFNSGADLTLDVATWQYPSYPFNTFNKIQHFQVPVYLNCTSLFPDDYQNYLSYDKFCAGSASNSTFLRTGDSGGGIFLKLNGRFYLAGVISHKPPPGVSESYQFVLYTRISDYAEKFLLKNLQGHVPDKKRIPVKSPDECVSNFWEDFKKKKCFSGSCLLPVNTKNGHWVLGKSPDVRVGESVASGFEIRLVCEAGFVLKGENGNFCLDGRWVFPFGKCERYCPEFEMDEYTEVKCRDKYGRGVDCVRNEENSIAKFSCKDFSLTRLNIFNPRPLLCQDGRWLGIVPQCVKF